MYEVYIDSLISGRYSVGTMLSSWHRTIQGTGQAMTPRHMQSDTGQSYAPLVRKLIDHDSGAAIALFDLLRCGRKFGASVGDDAAWCLTMLDTLGICGANLHVLWGDVCHCSAEEMLSLLRACHEGRCGVSRDTITFAIECCNQGAAPPRELRPVSVLPGL